MAHDHQYPSEQGWTAKPLVSDEPDRLCTEGLPRWAALPVHLLLKQITRWPSRGPGRRHSHASYGYAVEDADRDR